MSGTPLPSASLTELPPAGQVAATAPADVAVFIGCASGGTPFQIYPFGAQAVANMTAALVNGPLVAEGGYIQQKVPVQTLFVPVPATSVSASASAIDHSGVTGTAVPGAIAGTILDGYDVVVVITTGGTIGTSYSYKVSLDGGNTFGTTINVTTSLSMAITGTLNGVSIATGITVALTSTQTFVTNDRFVFWTQPASATILPQTTTRANGAGGTSTYTLSGTPNDGYEVLIQFISGGTEGLAGITFWVSLDGGLNFGPVTNLPTNGTYVIPDGAGSSGLTLTVGSGVVGALDTLAARTTPPVPQYSDVQTAMDAVRGYSGAPWSFFHLVGYSTRAMRDSIESHLQSYATSGRFTWGSVSARDRITGETVAASLNNVAGDTAWSNRLVAEWGTSAGNRTPPHAGSSRVTSPISGARQNRRSDALQYLARTIGISPDTDPGDRTLPNGGACSSDTLITAPTSGIITPANAGAIVEHDARLNPTLFGLGFNVLRTWYGEEGVEPGVFPAGGRLMSAATDIQRWSYRRVLNLADAAMYKAMANQILSKFAVWPRTARAPYNPGDIMPWDLNRMTLQLYLALRAAVGAYVSQGNAPNGVGGIFVQINPTPGQVAGQTVVYASCQLTWKEFLDQFSGTIGFVNPSLGALAAPPS